LPPSDAPQAAQRYSYFVPVGEAPAEASRRRCSPRCGGELAAGDLLRLAGSETKQGFVDASLVAERLNLAVHTTVTGTGAVSPCEVHNVVTSPAP